MTHIKFLLLAGLTLFVVCAPLTHALVRRCYKMDEPWIFRPALALGGAVFGLAFMLVGALKWLFSVAP